MIDNLRRTLLAPAAFLALAAGWTLLSWAPAALWTGFVLATLAIPALLPLLTGLLPRRLGISKRSHLRAIGGGPRAGRLAGRSSWRPSSRTRPG